MSTERTDPAAADVSRLRPAARALIVDPADRILLVCFGAFPGRDPVWATPGGGIEPGEDVHAALRRELIEEVGLYEAEIGPHLWSRTYRAAMGRWEGQREHVHLVRTGVFEPRPLLDTAALAAEGVSGMRWWTLRELQHARDLRFAPRQLVGLVADVLRLGPPTEPLDIVS